MFDDIGTLCLVGIFLIVGLMLASRLFGGGGFRGTDFSQRGDERRTIDNPEVRSRGFFGGRSQSSGGSSFNRGTGGRSLFSGTRRTSSGRADNPEVKSRGGFGRDKK
jgi:hypothetical protein